MLLNETNNNVKVKPIVIYQREISCFLFVQRWIFIHGYADVLPGHSYAWFAIWKERQSQDTRIFPINTECKNCHQQDTFRAKGDSMCHVYPVEDCVQGPQGKSYKLPYTQHDTKLHITDSNTYLDTEISIISLRFGELEIT